MTKHRYVVSLDDVSYDRIGFIECGGKKFSFLFSTESQPVIVNYLLKVEKSELPDFLKNVCGCEVELPQVRVILEKDVSEIKKISTNYEFSSIDEQQNTVLAKEE